MLKLDGHRKQKAYLDFSRCLIIPKLILNLNLNLITRLVNI
jgi:hypothetical protein